MVDRDAEGCPGKLNGRFFCIFCFSSRSWLLGFLAFWLLGVWLLGFLASWLFGFLASWLFGFLASWLFGFSASGLFGFLALAFRILCIPSSSSAGGILAFAAFRWFMRPKAFCILCFPSSCAFWLLHPFIGFWMWLPASSASPVPLHGGGSPPGNPPATV